MGPSAARKSPVCAGESGGNTTPFAAPRSAISAASPPEQDIEAIRFEARGPTTCRIFSASSSAERLLACPIPNRASSAFAPASLPASEAVCEIVAARACSDTPTFTATMGLPRARASAASAS